MTTADTLTVAEELAAIGGMGTIACSKLFKAPLDGPDLAAYHEFTSVAIERGYKVTTRHDTTDQTLLVTVRRGGAK